MSGNYVSIGALCQQAEAGLLPMLAALDRVKASPAFTLDGVPYYTEQDADLATHVVERAECVNRAAVRWLAQGKVGKDGTPGTPAGPPGATQEEQQARGVTGPPPAP